MAARLHGAHQGRVQAGRPAAGGKAEVGVTGHVWDGDLQEYNNPLPKWWSNLFWITIFFSIVYLILYPGLGTFPGVLRWTSSGAFNDEIAASDARLKPLYEKYAKMDVEQIAADAAARQTGERMFLTYCSPCHGSDAGGSRGFPNLRDKDWLYGGTPEAIVTTITGGRMGVMPAFGPILGADGLPQRHGVRAVAVGPPARQPEGATRQDALHDELRGVPRRRRQGQPGARRAQPDRQRLAVRQLRDRDRPRASAPGTT